MNKRKNILLLFLMFLKIGVFTFGGGYAMIHILDNEFVAKKKWISSEEFLDLVSIAESTPGPIAINCATYLGYKLAGVLGSIIATLGVCIPSFTIIYVISLVFDTFLKIQWVAAAFRGIQCCVIFLIFSAGIKMLKKLKKSVVNIIILIATIACMLVFSLLSVSFSSIFYVLISASIGVLVYAIGYIKNKQASNQTKEEK